MDNKKEKLYPSLSKKLSLNLKIKYNEIYEINKDPGINLISNYNDIEKILKLNEREIIKFLYFNRINIHNILYNEDKLIPIKYDEKNNHLSYFFYLSLLIMENINIINYYFSIDYIKEIYKEKINKNNKYKLIIFSKFIIELINNYRGINEFYENENNKLEFIKIENESKNNIKNNIYIFKEIDLDINEKDIKLKKIEEIYILIINALIKKRKFEDYEFTYNIINQLDLENINITYLMFKELYNILNSNEDYIIDYIIFNEEDLNNENKINFYYILIKYILKNPIYIYQISFLYQTRINIISIINSELKKLSKFNINDNLRNKIDYIIEIILDTQYFYNKYLNFFNANHLYESNKETKKNSIGEAKESSSNTKNNLTNNSNKNKIEENENNNYLNIIKNNEIDENNYQMDKNKNLNNEYINELISFNGSSFKDNNEKENYIKEEKAKEDESFSKKLKDINNNDNFKDIKGDIESFLKDSTYTIYINKDIEKNTNYEEISINENISNNDDFDKLTKNIDNFKNKDLIFDEYKILYKNFIELINFIKHIEERIKKELINKFKLNINLKFKENKEKNIGEFKYISCEYQVDNIEINIIDKNNIYIDEDILNNQIHKNFDLLLKKLNEFIASLSSITQNNPYSSNSKNTFNQIINVMKKASVYNIIEFRKIIGEYKTPIEYIKEIKNNYYIIINIYNIIFYYYITYNEIFKKELFHSNICEIENEDINRELIVFSRKNIYEYNKSNNSFNIILQNINNIDFRICFIINKILIICGKKGIFSFYNLYNKNLLTCRTEISKESVFGGIKINKNIIAFTSNKIISNGDDKILFYNINLKIFYNNINISGYSFNISQNNLSIIPREEKKSNNKILLCACKKYIKEQKNGILIIKLKLNDSGIVKTSKDFYDTKDFGVYCFCPILIINNLYNDILGIKKNEIIDTEYFLVGGFDFIKHNGLIKLFKIVYNDNFEESKIEFIQDIKIKKSIKKGEDYFDEFKGPITCMIQSTYTGNIIISCFDGKVYLFSTPNINGYNGNFKII